MTQGGSVWYWAVSCISSVSGTSTRISNADPPVVVLVEPSAAVVALALPAAVVSDVSPDTVVSVAPPPHATTTSAMTDNSSPAVLRFSPIDLLLRFRCTRSVFYRVQSITFCEVGQEELPSSWILHPIKRCRRAPGHYGLWST